jgi:hypothetical protein
MTTTTTKTKAKTRKTAMSFRARRALLDLGTQGVTKLKEHPLGAVVGAFATGVALAKLVGRG